MPKRRCDRCGDVMRPGGYYDVTLEVKSDRGPLEITRDDLRRDTQAEIDDLVEQLKDVDPATLEADVYKLMKFRICRGCQQVLLHDPLQRGALSAQDWPEFDVDDFLDSLDGDGHAGTS